MKKILYLLGALALSTCAAPAYAQDINADVNLNNAECIRSIEYIGSTTYVNICTGVSETLEWGAVTWLGFLVISVIVVLVLGVVSAFVTLVVKEY